MLFYVNHSCRRLITRPAHTARENTLTKNVCRAAVAAPKAIHPVRLGPLAPASAPLFSVPVVGAVPPDVARLPRKQESATRYRHAVKCDGFVKDALLIPDMRPASASQNAPMKRGLHDRGRSDHRSHETVHPRLVAEQARPATCPPSPGPAADCTIRPVPTRDPFPRCGDLQPSVLRGIHSVGLGSTVNRRQPPT